MGSWILVPRTRRGDDLVHENYAKGTRQLVILGAGMDARAWRLSGTPELSVYEVDQPTTFAYKEPLVSSEKLLVKKRIAVPADFDKDDGTGEAENWETELLASDGFDKQEPSLWLLEGLVYYLPATKVPVFW